MSRRFPNFAHEENPAPEVIAEVSAACQAELTTAGIKAFNVGILLRGEVPTTVMGDLDMWGFTRNWYYWVARGPGLPVEIAERLHAEHGKEVRVDGHCGCPSPRELFKGFGVGLYHVDTPAGLKALADALRSVGEHGGEVQKPSKKDRIKQLEREVADLKQKWQEIRIEIAEIPRPENRTPSRNAGGAPCYSG